MSTGKSSSTKKRRSSAGDDGAPPTKKPKLASMYTRTDPKTGELGRLRKKDDNYWANFSRRAEKMKQKREEARRKQLKEGAKKKLAAQKKKEEKQKKKEAEQKAAAESESEIDSEDQEQAPVQREDQTKFKPFYALTQRFKDNVVMVTGGGRGIGQACALRLAQEGAFVYVVDYKRWKETVDMVREAQKQLHEKQYEKRLAAYYAAHGKWTKLSKSKDKAQAKAAGAAPKKPRRIRFKDRVWHKQCDVTDAKAVQKVVDEIFQERGYIDVVLNCVNTTGKDYGDTKSHEVKPDQFDRVLKFNLNSTMNVCRAVVPYMLDEQYGRIINLAAQDGKTGAAKCAGYAAAKAAVINLTKTLGQEYAGSGITVNCVAPQYDEYHAKKLGKTYAAKASKVPMGRAIDMEELAGAVAFVASEENTYTTGFCYDLTGGTGTY